MTYLYLTPTELRRAPTGQNWTEALEDKLDDLCLTVSGLTDNACQGSVTTSQGPSKPYQLRASVDTETANTQNRMRVLVDRRGALSFRASYRPVRRVVAMEYRRSWPTREAAEWVAVEPDRITIEGRNIVGWAPSLPSDELEVRVSYINGWPNGLLTAAVEPEASEITVDDPIGYLPGDTLTIYDDEPEVVVVSDAYAGGNPIVLSQGLRKAHAAGIRASALHPDIRQAAIWFAMDVMQGRGAQGFVPTSIEEGDSVRPPFVNYGKKACNLLAAYTMTP